MNTQLRVDPLATLEEGLLLPCDGESHPLGHWGHDPRQPATFAVYYPCGGIDLRCASWVNDLPNWGGSDCVCAGSFHAREDIRAVPLSSDVGNVS